MKSAMTTMEGSLQSRIFAGSGRRVLQETSDGRKKIVSLAETASWCWCGKRRWIAVS